MKRYPVLFIMIVMISVVYSADFQVSSHEVMFGDKISVSIDTTGTAEVRIPDFSLMELKTGENSVVFEGIPLKTGVFPIPPDSVKIGQDSDTIYFPTQTVEVNVLSRIADDTGENLLEPDAPMRDIPTVINRRNVTIAVVILLCVLLILYFFIFRRKIEEVVFKKKREPEHKEALRRIKELRVKNYLSTGNQKAYCVELSSIIRAYLGRRYRFPAHEMTTEELDKYFVTDNPDIPDKDTFLKYFRQMDLVKFAKYTLDKEILAGIMDFTEEYVNRTRRTEDET